MPPAKHALVGAREAGRRLHAPVRLDTVEGVLVTPPASTELRLGPPAQLHAGVRAEDLVPLLSQRGSQLRRHHLALLPALIPAQVLHVHAVLGPSILGAVVVVVSRAFLGVRVVKGFLLLRCVVVVVGGRQVGLLRVRPRRGGRPAPVNLLRTFAIPSTLCSLVRATRVDPDREPVRPVVELFLHLPRALVAVAPAKNAFAAEPGEIGVEGPGRRVESFGSVLPVAAPEHRELDLREVQHPEPLVPGALGRPLAEPLGGVGRGGAVGGLVRGENHEHDVLLDQVLRVVVRHVHHVEVDVVSGAEGVGELVRQPARGARLRSVQDLAPGHGRALLRLGVVVGATAPGGVLRVAGVDAAAALGAARVGRFRILGVDRDGGVRRTPIEAQPRPKPVPEGPELR